MPPACGGARHVRAATETPARARSTGRSAVARREAAPKGRTEGELAAINPAQARGGSGRPVEGITEETGQVNPDHAPAGAADREGMAGPVGYFEGEGNEGPLAPLGGDVTRSAADGEANSQGGVASGAPG